MPIYVSPLDSPAVGSTVHLGSEAMIELVEGDITTQSVDVIVNAANSDLAHGGGVAAAIARAAGPDLRRESAEYPRVPVGGAGVTTAGELPARWVVHAVGPVWSGGDDGEPELLAGAYSSALGKAIDLGARSIAFPSISTGIFGYPIEACRGDRRFDAPARLAGTGAPELIRICLFAAADLEVYEAALAAAQGDAAEVSRTGGQPGPGGRDVCGVDLVAAGALAVVDGQSGAAQEVAGGLGEPDADHVVVTAVGDEHGQFAAVGQRRLPALDRRDEAAEGEDPRRRRPIRFEAERVAHHRAHRESAEDRPLLPDPGSLPGPIVEIGERPPRRFEALRIRIADPRNGVPVAARPSRQPQRPARGDDVEAALRVENLGQADQIVLVGAAAVVEQEQPFRVSAAGRSSNSRLTEETINARPQAVSSRLAATLTGTSVVTEKPTKGTGCPTSYRARRSPSSSPTGSSRSS